MHLNIIKHLTHNSDNHQLTLISTPRYQCGSSELTKYTWEIARNIK